MYWLETSSPTLASDLPLTRQTIPPPATDSDPLPTPTTPTRHRQDIGRLLPTPTRHRPDLDHLCRQQSALGVARTTSASTADNRVTKPGPATTPPRLAALPSLYPPTTPTTSSNQPLQLLTRPLTRKNLILTMGFTRPTKTVRETTNRSRPSSAHSGSGSIVQRITQCSIYSIY